MGMIAMLQLQEKTLAHYTIQHRIARGGMSEVYLACDEQTQERVAIKVVHDSDSEHFARFQREIKMLNKLAHEYILPIIEYGRHGSWYYCVMPYIEHGTLRKRLAQGPLSEDEADKILQQLASALQFAHDHGILHRDIKPSNILLQEDGHVYLADFGLAKEMGEVSEITQIGCLIGTPEYMAPELAEQPATPSSDIYALGIILYQMLTGQVPFKGKTPISIYWKQIKEQPVPPSVLNPSISYDVEQVILKALEKNPARRFTTVQGMVEAYARAMHASEQTASDILKDVALALPVQRVIPVAVVRERRVHPAVVALLAAFLLLVPLTLGFSVYNSTISIQAPLALGANAQLAVTVHKPSEFPAIPKPTLLKLQKQQVDSTYEYSEQNNGSEHHGHEHGHHEH